MLEYFGVLLKQKGKAMYDMDSQTFIENVIVPIAAPISAAIIVGLIGIFGYRYNKQQRVKANESITKKRIEAITAAIEFERKANVFEYLHVAHPELSDEVEFDPLETNVIYFSIMESSESLLRFYAELSYIRNTYESWLSCKSAAYLLYAEKYIIALLSLLKKLNCTDNLFIYGTLLAVDVSKWQKSFDQILTKELNEVPLKNESHVGPKWESEKQKLEEALNESVLYGMLKPDIDINSL